MHYHDFIGERIQADEAKDVAGPLAEIDRYLREADSGQRFDFSEFLSRVADRAKVDEGDAKLHAQAITALVADVVPEGEVSDLVPHLPPGYEELFAFVDAGEEGAPW